MNLVARKRAGSRVVTLRELVDGRVLELTGWDALLKETVELSVGAAL